jgi:hypothetical protein
MHGEKLGGEGSMHPSREYGSGQEGAGEYEKLVMQSQMDEEGNDLRPASHRSEI